MKIYAKKIPPNVLSARTIEVIPKIYAMLQNENKCELVFLFSTEG